MIAKITRVVSRYYPDNDVQQTTIDWIDHRGRSGSTVGDARNPHMQALIARAERENLS